MSRLNAVAVIVCAFALSISAANAKPLRHKSGIIVCNQQGCHGDGGTVLSPQHASRSVEREDISFIANPAGCRRIALSCACRLAAYWGLGSGLDKVSTWPRVFARTHGPAVGVAAVRRDQHHIIGIIGGGPGAWRVADFNSGGHKNREYTVSDFRGYFFVDTRTRTASR